MEYFVGLDPGQTNQGIAIIDRDLNIIQLHDTGKNIPSEYKGKGLADIVRNSYVYYQTKNVVESVKIEEIKMCLMEGPNYSSTYNVTPISIGSIHGQNQIYFWDKHIDFVIVPPRSIQVGVHGSSVDIKKKDTQDKMIEIFGAENLPKKKKDFTTNMADALGMAYLARQLYLLITEGTELTVGEQKLFLAKTKVNGHKRGLVYNIGNRLFIFDKDGNSVKPNDGETLKEFYYRVKGKNKR